EAPAGTGSVAYPHQLRSEQVAEATPDDDRIGVDAGRDLLGCEHRTAPPLGERHPRQRVYRNRQSAVGCHAPPRCNRLCYNEERHDKYRGSRCGVRSARTPTTTWKLLLPTEALAAVSV